MLPMEIERKFTINYLPDNIKSVTKITQKHIFKDMVCSIRVRRRKNIYTYNKGKNRKFRKIFNLWIREKYNRRRIY